MDKRALRLGGLAGVLAGISAIVAFGLAIASPIFFLPGERFLAAYPQNAAIYQTVTAIYLVAILLFVPALAAIYWSLKGASRSFALLGVGMGVLALTIILVSLAALGLAANFFGGLYAAVPIPGISWDLVHVVTAYTITWSLLTGASGAGFLLAGASIVAFGVAMRESADYSGGFVWLAVVLGVVTVLVVFLPIPPVSPLFASLFGLVFGWKVYQLSLTP